MQIEMNHALIFRVKELTATLHHTALAMRYNQGRHRLRLLARPWNSRWYAMWNAVLRASTNRCYSDMTHHI